ncbi:MAG: hypothetical protein K1X74_08135 [Pirellulales bacterium]|nr:hypothetical protein [Pirellulales bacterium]
MPVLWWLFGFLLLCVLFGALSGAILRPRAVPLLMLWSLALAANGVMLGVLFGRPRFAAGYSLERIVRGLTWLMAALALVFLHRVPELLGRLAVTIAAGVDGSPAAEGVALALIVSVLPTGLLIGLVVCWMMAIPKGDAAAHETSPAATRQD